MGRSIKVNLDADTEKKLTALAAHLGYSREMAAVYAVRLVSACVREGLISDMPERAWPGEAQRLVRGGARVLEMPRKKSAVQGETCV